MAEVFNTNLLNVSAYYLELLKISVTKTTLKQQLQENPYFPSLYSLSNVFERFHLDTTALKVGKENFDKLHPPFVAYLNGQTTGKDFVLVTAVSENEVVYIAENKKPKQVSKETFLKNWQGIVFIAEANEKSGEADFINNRKKETIAGNKTKALIGAGVFILAASIYFFLYSLPANFILNAALLLLIKLAGIAVTTLLLIYEIDKSNAFVKSICTAGKQTNCAAVLQSKASKILGMSWSEAGFFYFASTFLFLLFPGLSFMAKICLLSIANCLAAPYILFSVYYQWKVVKQWCPLCLTVQAVLFLELLWATANYWAHPFLPIASFVHCSFACCLLPFITCFVVVHFKTIDLKSQRRTGL